MKSLGVGGESRTMAVILPYRGWQAVLRCIAWRLACF
jgi:hypothetical protein